MRIKKVREHLKEIISGDVLWEKEILNYYSVDASSYQIIPKVVVIPKDEKDVIKLVKFAKKIKMSVTVRGSGTGLVGSALNYGIVLDLKNLSSIKIQKNIVKVGAGIVKGRLDENLREVGKFFPPNPSIGAYCSVGGMLGNNSSGSRSLKYGSVIDNVKEIVFVNGIGQKIKLPQDAKVAKKIIDVAKKIEIKRYPAVSKNSSGYRLDSVVDQDTAHKAIIGSEGTLGIILSAKFKIRDIPKKRILTILEYQSLKKAASDCEKIVLTNPSAVEFVDKKTLKQIPKKFQNKTKCLLFVEYDEKPISRKNQLGKLVSGKITVQTDLESEICQWWKYRDSSLYYSLRSIKKKNRIPHVIEDAAVPIEKLHQLFLLVNEINQKFKTKSIMYGHAGNANIHVRLIADRKKIKEIANIAEFYFNKIIQLGGTITGEHGDGLARSEYVKVQYGKKNYAAFKQLKKLLDPYNILNPGKIIARKSTIMKNFEIF